MNRYTLSIILMIISLMTNHGKATTVNIPDVWEMLPGTIIDPALNAFIEIKNGVKYFNKKRAKIQCSSLSINIKYEDPSDAMKVGAAVAGVTGAILAVPIAAAVGTGFGAAAIVSGLSSFGSMIGGGMAAGPAVIAGSGALTGAAMGALTGFHYEINCQ